MTPLVVGGVFDLPDLGEADDAELESYISRAPGVWHISGRSALKAILAFARTNGVRHLHVPAYLCSSVLDAVHASGVEYSFYMVRADLSIDVDPRPNSAVLLIHYFGWEHPSAAALRESDVTLIEDASQGSLSSWAKEIDHRSFVITNLRKFGPVPVGAWSSLVEHLASPDAIVIQRVDNALDAARAKHGYLRERGSARNLEREALFVRAFLELESALESTPDSLALPPQFFALLARVDWAGAAATRRANWQALSAQLPQTVLPLDPKLDPGTVPLGLPIRVAKRDAVRASMAQAGVLCPVHWHLPPEVDPRRFPEAVDLSSQILTLPIDQRYDVSDMQFVAEALAQASA